LYFDQLTPLLFFFFLKLAGTNRPVALAQANAMLNRIDLICEVRNSYCYQACLSLSAFLKKL
jgi:hypothetical protein